MQNYQTYYAMIQKPFFAPEPWVFGFAWGIIYPLIAIAGVLTLYYWYSGRVDRTTVLLFLANIVANLAFTPVQLGLPETVWPTVAILLVLGTLVMLMKRLCAQNEKLIMLLLLPYLLWGAFATVLQITITTMNGFWW